MNNVVREKVIVIIVLVPIVTLLVSGFGLISLYNIKQEYSISSILSDNGISCHGRQTSRNYTLINKKIAFVDCDNITVCPDPACNAPIYMNMTVYLQMKNRHTDYFLIITKSAYVSHVMELLAPSILAIAVAILLIYMVIKSISPVTRPTAFIEDNPLLSNV